MPGVAKKKGAMKAMKVQRMRPFATNTEKLVKMHRSFLRMKSRLCVTLCALYEMFLVTVRSFSRPGIRLFWHIGCSTSCLLALVLVSLSLSSFLFPCPFFLSTPFSSTRCFLLSFLRKTMIVILASRVPEQRLRLSLHEL